MKVERKPIRFRRLAICIALYGVYLIMRGPFYGLISRPTFSFVPDSLSDVFWLPATPVYKLPLLRSVFDDYVNFWNQDPEAADSPKGS